jgi:hypothetical protein
LSRRWVNITSIFWSIFWSFPVGLLIQLQGLRNKQVLCAIRNSMEEEWVELMGFVLLRGPGPVAAWASACAEQSVG